MRIKKILFGYFFFAILSGIALAIWRTVLMIRYYDPYNNEYPPEAEAALESLGVTLLFIFILLATSALFLIRFEFGSFSASEDQFSVFTSALLGFVFLAIGVFISFYLKEMTEAYVDPFYQNMTMLTYVLLFFCAVYFVFNAAGNARFENARKMLSLATPVWGIAFLISSYLDPTHNYKDYDHMLCIVAICALVFFLLYDTGMAVKNKATVPYFVFALLSIVASAVYMIPNFVLMAYWELSSNVSHIFEAALLGTVFYTCACTRNLCLSVKVREKKPKAKKSQ